MSAETLEEAILRVQAAQNALVSGDPEPYMSCWAQQADVTLFGAWGTVRDGWDGVKEALQWVRKRPEKEPHRVGSAVRWETVAMGRSGDLAYVAWLERGQNMVFRVTHIFARRGTRWLIIHRHGDVETQD